MNVAAAATRHSQSNRMIMRDWISHCIETDRPMPTNEQICERFGFVEPEQARTLLADLADQGLITIRYAAGERQIALGRVKSTACTAAKPGRSVLKQDREIDQAVQKIMDIVKPREPAPAIAEAPPPAAPPTNPAGQSAAGNGGGSHVDRSAARAEPVIARAERPLKKAREQRAALAPEVSHSPPTAAAQHVPHSKRKQINIRLSPLAQQRFDEICTARQMTAGGLATDLIENLLFGIEPPTVPMTGKPLIRADVLRAANEEKKDLHLFVGDLIALGFERWREGSG